MFHNFDFEMWFISDAFDNNGELIFVDVFNV